MRALDEVVASGRARFVGVSNFTGADAGRVRAHAARRRLAGRLPHARPPAGAGDLPALPPRGHRGDGLRLARPRAAHRRLHRRHRVRPCARLARGRGRLRPADLPRRQSQDERGDGGPHPPRGRGAARGGGEPDRARLGARQPRGQYRAGGRAHPRGGGRQRRGRRARAVAGRARADRRDPRGGGRPRAGVHPAAAGDGAVGRGAAAAPAAT